MGLAVSSIGSVTFRFTAPKIVWDVVSNAPVVSDSRAETIPPRGSVEAHSSCRNASQRSVPRRNVPRRNAPLPQCLMYLMFGCT